MDNISEIYHKATDNLLENNYEESLKQYQSLRNKDIKNPALEHNYALTLFVLKKYEDALKIFQDNCKLYPEYYLSYFGEINCYIYMKQYEEALLCANKYVENKKLFIHPQLFFILSYLYKIHNNMELSKKSYKFAEELIRQLIGTTNLEDIDEIEDTQDTIVNKPKNDIIETTHLVQCFYDNGYNKIYYMT